MREVLDDIARWRTEGQQVALATVIAMHGSAPRGVGASLAVSDGGGISGSVSNGCVEPAVIEEGLAAIQDGRPRLLTFGISEAQNVERIGLSCGGEISVFVEPWPESPVIAAIERTVRDGEACARVVVLSVSDAPQPIAPGTQMLVPEVGDPLGSLGDASLDAAAVRAAHAQLRRGESASQTLQLGEGREVEVFVGAYPAPSQLIIIGAGHIAIPLSQLAKVLGYRVVIVDPRAAFNTRDRLSEADDLLLDWPDEALARLPITSATAVAVLTHDNKFDVPALKSALASPAGYVGAIGSRNTIRERNALLREAGVSDEALDRIHGPIGLDIGARRPEEIALAILAQIVASRRKGTGE